MLGAVRHTEHGEPLRWPTGLVGLVSLPGRFAGSPSVGYTRYDAAAVSNEALLPLNPPGTAAPGAVLVCAAVAAGSFGALIMMSGPV